MPRLDLSRHARRLSEELRFLAERFDEQEVELAVVIDVLQERAFEILCLLFALPFCVPVLPGLSTPFGLVIALVAGSLALGYAPWLPARLRRQRLPPRFFRTLFNGSQRFVGGLERVLRVRWPWLTASRALIRLHFAVVCVAGVILLIPAPLPFSNTLPALGIVLCLVGLIERDGLALLGGYLFTLVGGLYFVLAAGAGVEVFAWLQRWWSGL